MNKKIKHKKADIPVTILIIGIFAVCTLAIIGFKLIELGNTKKIYENIEAAEKLNSEIQKYYFYKKLPNIDENEINNLLNVKTDNQGKYLEIVSKEGNLILRYHLK